MVRKLGFVMAFVTTSILSLQAATISGVVKEGDSTGVVVPNAIVTLSTTGAGGGGGGGGGGVTLTDTTDELGAFSFTEIAVSNRQLRATKTGYQNSSSTIVAVTDSAAGVYVKDLYLVSNSIRANVTGTVTDTVSALPLANAQVVIRKTGSVGDTVITDTAGLFKFDTLAPGTYTVSVSLTGYTAKSTSVTISSATVPAIAVQLAPIVYATVSGTVTDSVSTSPVPAARVILQSGTRRDTVVTTATGAFSFDSVASGTYTLNTSLTGYTTKSTSVSVSSATVPAISILLVPIQYASISGTILDSTAATAISGATVILKTSGGMGTAVDTTVTDTLGKYTFATVTSGKSYTLSVTATGYVAKTTAAIALTGTTAVTADVKILAITMGKITGIVTSDSLKGPAVSGATVVLSLRSSTGGGGSGTPIDTMTSDSTGAFLFENVASGSNYRVTATLTGYTSAYSSITGKTGGIDTANIVMSKVGTGSLLVRVLKQADSTGIPSATITAVTTGSSSTSLSGVSGADGSAVLSGFEITTTALSISVTASATGYTAAAGSGSIPKNGSDTVTIYLTAAATGTKLLQGVVSDSTSKEPLSNVRVVLTITSGGGGGGTSLTFIDTTGADGAYTFSGIPVNRNTGTLAATLTGYPNFSRNNVAIGAANAADTATFNIVLLKTTAVVSGAISAIVLRPDFRLSATGILQLKNFSNIGMVKIFSVDGKLLFKSAFNSQTKAIRLPASLAGSGKALLVSVSQNNEVYRKQIMIP
jgi:hypothetical protein